MKAFECETFEDFDKEYGRIDSAVKEK